MSFAAGFTPLLIVAASFFNKKAYWKSRPSDYFLMAGAILGILLWALTDNPNLAILFSLLADMLAGMPTLMKSYRHPQSESWIAYAVSAFGFGISFLSIQTHRFETTTFVIYLFVLNGLCAAMAARGRRHKQTIRFFR